MVGIKALIGLYFTQLMSWKSLLTRDTENVLPNLSISNGKKLSWWRSIPSICSGTSGTLDFARYIEKWSSAKKQANHVHSFYRSSKKRAKRCEKHCKINPSNFFRAAKFFCRLFLSYLGHFCPWTTLTKRVTYRSSRSSTAAIAAI